MKRLQFAWSALQAPLLALAMVWVFACEPKFYPDADPDEIAAWEATRDATQRDPTTPRTDVDTAINSERGEQAPIVGPVESGTLGGGQSATAVSCESDAGLCSSLGDAGVIQTCIPKGPRDCTSELDNDCDGQPDDVIDDVCVCTSGIVELCNEHSGLDGQGQCRAGLRTCLFDEVAGTTSWGECDGAIGPGEPEFVNARETAIFSNL